MSVLLLLLIVSVDAGEPPTSLLTSDAADCDAVDDDSAMGDEAQGASVVAAEVLALSASTPPFHHNSAMVCCILVVADVDPLMTTGIIRYHSIVSKHCKRRIMIAEYESYCKYTYCSVCVVYCSGLTVPDDQFNGCGVRSAVQIP